MKSSSIFIFLILATLLATPAHSASDSWDLDKGHSNVYFSVDHIFSKVRGHFNDFETEIVFNPDQLDKSRFNFTITVDSIDTNITKRDKHLISADFFDAGKFPKMVFTSTNVTEAGGGMYQVEGKLEVKGETYDLTLPLTLAGVKDHPAMKGKEVAGFNGTVVIDRLAHSVGGGKFYDMGLIGKDVEVFVSLEVTRGK